MNRHAHGLRANALVQPEYHREKKRQHQTSGESCLKKACQNRRERATSHGDEQPRETKPKDAPRRRASNLFKAKPERLKKFGAQHRGGALSTLTVTCLQNFLREQVRVDHADDAALPVHHWKGEKFVEHEKFARVEDSGGRGGGDNAREHDLTERRFPRRSYA